MVEYYLYDVYGKTTIKDTSHTTQVTSQISNPYMFTGRRLDEESGIYYYRARMYDPNLGRFLQRDPLGYFDSMNLFEYVGNNPVNWVDPWGEQMLPTLPWLTPLPTFPGLPNISYGTPDVYLPTPQSHPSTYQNQSQASEKKGATYAKKDSGGKRGGKGRGKPKPRPPRRPPNKPPRTKGPPKPKNPPWPRPPGWIPWPGSQIPPDPTGPGGQGLPPGGLMPIP